MPSIETCLNCTEETCSGNYPNCKKGKRKNRRSKLRELGHGNGTVLICLLAKLGIPRAEIASIVGSTQSDVGSLLNAGRKRGLITQEEIDATRLYAKNEA